jgi:hypothetical protein
MHALLTRLTKIFFVTIFALSYTSIASAKEINTESFSGTINTTLTSGFTMRASDRDCTVNFGFQHTSVVSAWGSIASQNGQGCSGYKTDGFGNTSTEYINNAGSNANTDDGNLNYDQGDVVNATQKFYTEIIGDTNGVGVNLSLTGSYNPVNDINDPIFKKLKTNAQHSLEQDLTLLNAYVTTDFELGDNFVDATIGRSVVSWGEATFIPVTANGLVTGALDITKLRAPGSSIKEALLPTEQIVLGTNINGIGIEAYYQFQADQVQLDVAGSFFGSEVVGTGESGLIAGGAFSRERNGVACPVHLTYLAGTATNCTAAIVAAGADQAHSADIYLDTAFDLAASAGTAATIGQGTTAGKEFGSASLAQSTLEGQSSAFGLTGGKTVADLTTRSDASSAFYQNSLAGFMTAMVDAGSHAPTPTERIAGVHIKVADDGKFKVARDDGQFGLKLTNYIDAAGGIDFSVYFANYHSKVPYLRVKGQKGLFAGDLYGLFNAAAYDQMDSNFSLLEDFTTGGQYNQAFTSNTFGQSIVNAVQEIAYSSAICSAALGKAMASVYSGGLTGNKFTTTAQERDAFLNYQVSTDVGEAQKAHDPNKCAALANQANTTDDARHISAGEAALGSASGTSRVGGGSDVHLKLMGTSAHVLAAVTPMNYFEYDFVFPEDNQIFGTSFSTVIDGTVVQGEVSYRPNFPLATPGGSQVNQLADASGATQTLNWLAYSQIDGLGQSAVATADAFGAGGTSLGDGLQLTLALQVLGASGAYTGDDTDVHTQKLRDFKRSSLPAISEATVKAGDYYSTPYIEYDVWSADIGTTSAFNASHPITVGLGADSVVLLTEAAMVHIDDLDNSNGYIARGGSSESGDDPNKCKGAFGTSLDFGATKAVTSLGASIVDGLFGNGGYCEDNPGAGQTSFTYRVIGSATYNNFANSQWSINPNFAWSHDPSGYGPSSLGGFVEGRMSLSLGMRANKGAVSASLSYVNQLGDAESNLSRDKDTLAASISYSF